MITINKDRGFVIIQNQDDLVELPGFVHIMEVEGVSAEGLLEDVFGQYNFSNKIPCGLSNCRTKHNKGYVAKTTDGRVTNIGKDCGTKFFGIDFKHMSNELDQAAIEYENRELINSFKQRVDFFLNRISALRSESKGADWASRSVKVLDGSKSLSSDSARALNRIRKNGGVVLKEKILSYSERQTRAISTGKNIKLIPSVEEERIGSLSGIDALNTYTQLRKILMVDLVPNLEILRDIDIESMPRGELKRFAKWVVEIERKIEQSSNIVADARKLLTVENFKPFFDLFDDKEERTELVALIRQLEASQ